MAFHEASIFPIDISYGSTGGAGYSTAITKLDSGQEIRSARWTMPKHQYDASYGIKSLAQLNTVLEFYHARQGSAHGFRWKDPMDFSTDTTRRGTPAWDDVVLAPPVSNTSQLLTRYISGSTNKTRTIEKPIAGTVKVGWGGAEKDGTSSGEVWSVDSATGIITSTDAGSSTVSAGCQFHVPCRFGEGIDEHLPLSMDAFDIGSIGQIPIVEIKGITENMEEYDFGGAKTYTAPTADIQYSHGLADGRVIYCTASSSYVITIVLPTITGNMPTGFPYFYVINAGAGGNVTVKDATGTLFSVAQNYGATIGIVIDGTRKYFAI